MRVEVQLTRAEIEDEVWRDIPDHPEYQVSNMGRVYSTVRGQILSQRICNGTAVVSTVYSKNVVVSRLVLKAFVGEPEGKWIAAHKDFDGCNNRLNNLQWMSASEHGRLIRERGLKK